MTNRDDNDESKSNADHESEQRATPSSLGLNLDDDAAEEEASTSAEDSSADADPHGEESPGGPAIGGQASDAEADDDPTRNMSREKVRETLMGMPAPEDNDQDDGEDEPGGSGESPPSSQSLLEESSSNSAQTEDDASSQSDGGLNVPAPSESNQPNNQSGDHAESSATPGDPHDDTTRPVSADQAESAMNAADTDPGAEPADHSRETRMGMGAVDPDDDDDVPTSGDADTRTLGDDDIEEAGEFDDDFGGEKTMVSSSPFGDVEDDDGGDDLPAPSSDEDFPDDDADFGEADIGDDEDLEEFGEYEKTMVSDEILEGPTADELEDSDGLDVTSTPGSPATEQQTANPSTQEPTPDPESQQSTGESDASPPAESQTNQQAPAPEHQAIDQDDQPDEPAAEEFSSQKTEVFASPFEDDPVCPKLTVLEGPTSGQEYLLNETRNTIGRATKNSVVVADESMSRQHLEIVKRPDGSYRVQDLQSVNGTYLNGTAIEESDIFHGDRLQTGRTTLQFLIPGDAPTDQNRDRRIVRADGPDKAQPAAAPQRTHTGTLTDDTDGGSPALKRTIIGATILCAILAGAVGYLWTLNPGPSKTQKQAQSHFLKAIQGIQASNWNEAEIHLGKARDLMPSLAGLDTQFQRLKTERSAQQSLQTARAAAENNNYDTAVSKARAVPENSVYYDEAQEILRRSKRARQVEQLLAKGQQAAEAGDRIEALSNIQQVLKVAPTHPQALQLRYAIKRGNPSGASTTDDDTSQDDTEGDASEAVASADSTDGDRAPTEDSTATGAAASESSAQGGSESDDDLWLIDDSEQSEGSSGADETVTVEEDPSSGGTMKEGFSLYKKQKFDAAISHFQSMAEGGDDSDGRAASIADAISQVKSSFQKGTKALDGENWSTAVSSLRAALRADKQVADVGHLSGVIQKKLASAVAGQGQSDLSSGNYADAFNHYKNARDYDSDHNAVRTLRRDLGDKASSLYIQAANSKKTSPTTSATLCRTITSMLPPEDETYKKAKSLLQEL